MKKKYLIAIISSIIFIISLTLILYFSLRANIVYEFDENSNSYFVSEVRGNKKSYTIPKSYNGYEVIGIGTRAFLNHDDLESVIFEEPKNIKSIGRLAFSNCIKLKEINLEYVEFIDKNAFSYDSSLNNIIISAKHINSSAFYKCESLENVTFLEGVKDIGTYAFSHTKIKEITLPLSLDAIYVDAFKYCDFLKTINCYNNLSYMNYLNSLNVTINIR